VVDDNGEQRATFARALADGGYAVEQAADAGEALRKALEAPPDVVVLDLVLPDARGVEVAGAFRAMTRTRRMPIVVVTAYTDAAEQLDPKRFSAECVLTKPVSDDELRAAVERCLVPAGDDAQAEL
jgi:CheY-like chemotaxis protein